MSLAYRQAVQQLDYHLSVCGQDNLKRWVFTLQNMAKTFGMANHQKRLRTRASKM